MTEQTATNAEPADLPTALIELRHAQGEVERLRHFVDMADAAGRETERLERQIASVRDLHREEYGCCEHCTGLYGVPYPCPTILALAATHDAADLIDPKAQRASTEGDTP